MLSFHEYIVAKPTLGTFIGEHSILITSVTEFILCNLYSLRRVLNVLQSQSHHISN
jgi:hypothetical protein